MVKAYDCEDRRTSLEYDPQVNPAVRAGRLLRRGQPRRGRLERGKIFVGTLDGRLVALDARTGAV